MQIDTINLLIATHSQDSVGRDVTSWTVDSTFLGDFQPVKYNVEFQPFGITDKTSNVIYMKFKTLMTRYYLPNTDPNQFNVTYRIGYNNSIYIIDSILPYLKHFEIYLEKVI
jgi:hypothetical protein